MFGRPGSRNGQSVSKSKASERARRRRRTNLNLGMQMEPLESRILLATKIWDGSFSVNWSDGANWDDDTAPVEGDNLVFPSGAANPTNTNDFPANTNFGSITIEASGYVLEGNEVDLDGDVATTFGSGASTIDFPVNLQSTRTFAVADGGELLIDNAVIGTFGLTKTGAGTLTLGGGPTANTYSGTTTVNAGTLGLFKTSDVDAFGGNLVIDGTTDSATVLLRTSNQIPDTSSVSLIGSGAAFTLHATRSDAIEGLYLDGGVVTIDGDYLDVGATGVTLLATQGLPASITSGGGALRSSGQTLTFNVADAATGVDLEVSAPLGSATGLTKTGVGTLKLSPGTNASYSGTTNINEGEVILAATSGAQAIKSPVVIGDNTGASATLTQDGDSQFTNSAIMTVNEDGTYNLGGNAQTVSNLTLQGGTVTIGASGVLTVASLISTQVTTGNATATISGSGALDLGGGVRSISVTDDAETTVDLRIGAVVQNGAIGKGGPGTLALSGMNTYAGDTYVMAGALLVESNAALGTTASNFTRVDNGASVYFVDGVNVAETFRINGSGVGSVGALWARDGLATLAGDVDLYSNSRIGAADGATLTINGDVNDVGDPFALTVGSGATGRVVLGGDNSGLNTAVNVDAGYLRLTSDWAVGYPAGYTTHSIASGASLELAGGITIPNTNLFELTGLPVSGFSKVINVSGDNTITGDIALTGVNNQSFDVASETTLTVSGEISGSFDFDKNGQGTLVLSGTSTHTGNVTVGDGLLLVDGSLATSNQVNVEGVLGGSGTVPTVNVTGIGTLAPGTSPGILNTGDLTFDGIGSIYAVDINGTTVGSDYDRTMVVGAVILAGATLDVSLGYVPEIGDSFTIIDNDDDGDAVVGTFDNLPEGAHFQVDGYWFQITYAGGNGDENDVVVTYVGTPTFTWDGGDMDDSLWSSPDNWVGNVAPVEGANLVFPGGALRLSNSNDFANDTNFGTITIAAAGYTLSGNRIDLDGGLIATYVTSTSTIDADIRLTGTRTIDVATGGMLDLSGVISGTGFGLTKIGDGTLVLTNLGNESGLTGGIAVEGGTLSVADDDALPTGTITLAENTTLSISGSTTIDNSIALGGLNVVVFVWSGHTAGISGVILELVGVRDLYKSGGGTLNLSAANTYTGSTYVNAGTLSLSGGLTISDGSAVTVANGATLRLLASETIGSLSGDGLVDLGAFTLTTGGNNTSTSFGGVIEGSGGLSKSGTGTLTLSGDNTFGGDVNVSSGTVIVQSNTALGSTDGSTSVAPGAAVGFSGPGLEVAEDISIVGVGGGEGSLGVVQGSVTLTGTINTTGDATLFAASSTTLTIEDDFTTASGHTLTIGGDGVTTFAGANPALAGEVFVASGATLVIENNNALGGTSNGTTVDDGASLHFGVGGLNIFENLTISGTGVSSGGVLVTTVGVTILSGAITLDGEAMISTGADTTLLVGVISDDVDSHSLIKSGTGTMGLLSLTGNMYDGGTFVDEGVLTAVHSDSLGTGDVAVSSGAALTLMGDITIANNMEVAGTGVAGDGAIVNEQGANTITGAVTLVSNSSIGVAEDSTLTISGAISGLFGLAKLGAGVLILDATSTYSGTTTISEGVLQVDGTIQSAVSLNGGALSGSGTISDAGITTASPSSIDPGTVGGAGLLTYESLNQLVFTSNTTFVVDLNGTTVGTEYDRLDLSLPGSSINLGLAELVVNVGYLPTVGDSFQIIAINSLLVPVGNFADLLNGATFESGPATFTISYAIQGVYLTVTDVTIPTYVWDGGGSTDNWSDPLNWDLDEVPVAYAHLVFPGAVPRTNNNNDLASGTIFSSITIGAAGYSLNGNAIELLEGISSTFGSSVSYVTLDLELLSDVTVEVASGGTLYLQGAISGASGLTKEGLGTLMYGGGGSNTYTGTTTVNAGMLVLSKTSGLATGGDIVLGDGTGTDTLRTTGLGQLSSATNLTLNEGAVFDTFGFSASIGSLTMTGASVNTGLFGVLTLGGDVTTNASTITSTISGALDLGGATRTFTVAGGTADPDLSITATIAGTGAGLIKAGAGDLVLSGVNTYDGATSINAGKLFAGSATALGATSAGTTVASGATLAIGGGVTLAAEPLTVSGNGAGGVGALWGVSDDNSITGTVNLAGDTRIVIQADASLALTGVVDDGASTFGFAKLGAGTLSVSSANTYDGATSVVAGTLVVTNGTALGTGAVTVFSSAALSLGGGITVANNLTVSGNGPSDGAIRNLTGDNTLSGSITLAATSRIHVAEETRLTISGAIGESGGTRDLGKYGEGVLELGGASTFTGVVYVNFGTLLVTGDLTSTGSVQVWGTSTLAGSGATSAVDAGPGTTVSPGNDGTGMLTVNTTTLDEGTNLVIELGGTASGEFDVLNVGGALGITDSVLTVSLVNGYVPTLGDSFMIVPTMVGVTGTFEDLPEGSTFEVGGVEFTITYAGGGSGFDIVLTVTGATYVWSGLDVDDSLWTSGDNWEGNIAPVPGTGVKLVFPSGAQRLANVNDFAGNSAFGGITIAGAGYTLSGNTIDLSGDLLATYATGTSTIDINLDLQDDVVVEVADGGTLVLAGAISGAGFGLTVDGGGTVELAGLGDNTYGGVTQVLAGLLLLNKTTAYAIPGDLSIGDGSTAATVRLLADDQIADTSLITIEEGSQLDLNGQSDTVASLAMTAGLVSIPSGSTLTLTTGIDTYDPTSIAGSLIEGAGTLDLGGNATFPIAVRTDAELLTDVELRISAVIANGGIVKSQTGDLGLDAANTYAGATAVDAGILWVGNSGALGTTAGGTAVASGAAVYFFGAGLAIAEDFEVAGGGISSGGALRVASGDATLSGGITMMADTRFGTVDGAALTINGVIGDGAGTYTLRVNSGATGRTTLAGANTYGGATYASMGYLRAASANAFGEAGAASTVYIETGATLELSGGITIPATKSFTTAGTPVSGVGKFINVSGDNEIAGAITLGSNPTTFEVAASTTLTVSGAIGETGGYKYIHKTGAGTLVLSGTSTFTDLLDIRAGTAIVTGDIGISSDVYVKNGGILAGTGTVSEPYVYSGGTIAPGLPSDTGILTTTDAVYFEAGAIFQVDLNGATVGTGYDQLNVTGTVQLNNATLTVNPSYVPGVGTTFTIIANDSNDAINGTFAGYPEEHTFTIGVATYSITYVGGTDNNDVVLTVLDVSYIWDGEGSDDFWSTAENWVGDNVPTPGARLIFPDGAARLASLHDLGADFWVYSITIEGAGYTIEGASATDTIDLSEGITTTYAAGNSGVSLDIELLGSQTIDVSAGGLLIMQGAISGNCSDLTKDGAGTLEFGGWTANTYGGTTYVLAGTLNLAKAGGLDAVGGDIEVGQSGGGAATLVSSESNQVPDASSVTVQPGATWDLGTASEAIGMLVVNGGTVSIPSGTLSVTSITDLVDNDSLSVISGAGTLDFGGASVTIQVGPDTNLDVEMRISVAIANGTLFKTGIGLLALAGDNTFDGAVSISVGGLLVESDTALGTTAGATLVLPGGSLLFSGTLEVAESILLQSSGGSFGPALYVLDGETELSGTVNLIITPTLGAASGATLNITGVLGGAVPFSIANGATGRTILAGENSIMFGPSVTAGFLQLASDDALGQALIPSTTMLAAGATLELTGDITLPAGITIMLVGAAVADSAKVVNLDGDNTIGGPVTLGADSSIDVAEGTRLTISGGISGVGTGLTKVGSGTLVLAGISTYTLSTAVNAGTLQVDGSIGAEATSVASGASLIGSGLVGSLGLYVNEGGTLSPGNPEATAILSSGNVYFASGATFGVTLDGPNAGCGYDQLNVVGAVGLGNATLSITVLATPWVGDTFTIINNDDSDAIDGTFLDLPEGSTITLGAVTFTISYVGGDGGNDVVLTATDVVFIWDGGSEEQSGWADGLNWVGDVAPTPGARLVFPDGAERPENFNNFGSEAFQVHAIEINGDGYAISGDPIHVAGGISADYTGSSSISAELTLGDEGDFGVEVTESATLVLDGGLAGGVGFEKTGDGRLITSGGFTFPSYEVLGGTLIVNGSASGGGDVSVYGTLGGSGSVRFVAINAGGTLSPGEPDIPATLVSAGASFDAAATFAVDLDGTSSHDKLLSFGGVDLNDATLSINLVSIPRYGDAFTIIDVFAGYGSVTGTFAGLPEGSTLTLGNVVFTITYVGGDGNDVVLTSEVTYTWDGGDIDDSLWTSGDNWVGDVVPTAGARLIFPEFAQRKTNSLGGNDVTFDVHSIVLQSADYHISDGLLIVGTEIVASYASGTSRIDTPIRFHGGDIHLSGGTLALGGALDGYEGTDLFILGPGTALIDGDDANDVDEITIEQGTLLLGKAPGSDVVNDEIYAGPGAVVRYLASDQLNAEADINLEEGSLLDFNGFSDAFDNLVLEGSTVEIPAGSTFTILGYIWSREATQVSRINGPGTIDFNERSYVYVYTDDSPTVDVDLILGAVLANGGVDYTYDESIGTIAVTGANTYAGVTYIEGSTVRVENALALGAPGNADDGYVDLYDGSSLILAVPGLVLNEYIYIAGYGNGLVPALWAEDDATLNGELSLYEDESGPTTSIGAADGVTLTLAGVVSEYEVSMSLRILNGATGRVVLAGDNTFTGGVDMEAGFLHLAHDNALGDPASNHDIGIGPDATLELSGGITIPDTKLFWFYGEPVAGAAKLANLSGDNTILAEVAFLGEMTIDAAADSTLTLPAGLSDDGEAHGFTKTGAGTLALGTSDYTGSTTVADGTLSVLGDISASSDVTVAAGATLAGTGTTSSSSILTGGTIAPGASGPGILSTGDLDLALAAIYEAELDGLDVGTGYDQIDVVGAVTLSNAVLNLQLGDLSTAPNGSVFTIINNDGLDAVVGTFFELPEGAIVSVQGKSFQISYQGGTDDNDVVLTLRLIEVGPATIPTPTASSPYSQQLTASGGSGEGYVFSATGLPAGLSISPSGLITGTPTTANPTPVEVEVTVTDSVGGTTVQTYLISVSPAISVSPGTIPAPTLGLPYSQQLTASGGSGEGYVFSATGLPAGLSISPSGLITGTPTAAGAVTFTVTVTDSNDATGTQEYEVTVDGLDSATSLVSSTNPNVFGQPVTFTATVVSLEGPGVPSGTVTFYNGQTVLGTAPLVDGVAVLVVSNLGSGTHSITAAYSGDATYDASESSAVSQTTVIDSTMTLAATSGTAQFNPPITFTMTIAIQDGRVPTGVVEVYDGSTLIGVATFNEQGVATLTTSALAVGVHTFVAVYGGDGFYQPITSDPLTQEVGKALSQTGAIVSSTPEAFYGETVTLTATFSATFNGTNPMSGTVDFYDGDVYLGSAVLSPYTPTGSLSMFSVVPPVTIYGQAQLTTSRLAVGDHTIIAVYSGDAYYTGATSQSSVSVLIDQAQTATTLQVATSGTGATLTATVVVTTPGNPTISGSVAFYDGDTLIGTVPVANGVAVLNIAELAPGAHAFRAVYNGDGSASSSTSSVVVVVETDGPQVLGVSRYGVHASPTTLVLRFSSPLDAARAQDVANYRLVDARGRVIAIRSARYDAATMTVTLRPATRLALFQTYTLTVNGTVPTGLTGVNGVPLDGSGTGQPGTDYVTPINRSSLVFPVRRPHTPPVAPPRPPANAAWYRAYLELLQRANRGNVARTVVNPAVARMRTAAAGLNALQQRFLGGRNSK